MIGLRSAIAIVMIARSAIETAMIASRSGIGMIASDTALHSVTASRHSETTDVSASGACGRRLAGGGIGFGSAANAPERHC